MLIDVLDNQKLKVSFGCFTGEDISLKRLMKLEVDGVDAGFDGFVPISSDDEHSFMQRKYKLMEGVPVGKQETKAVAKLLQEHVDTILQGTVKNPVQSKKENSVLASFLDDKQGAAITAIIYNMKLRNGHSAVVGCGAFLTLEELVFLEDCLKISPYLKTKSDDDLSVSDLSIAVTAAYSEILKNRNGVDSLMALGGKELAVVYNDIPIALEESDEYPL